MSRWIPRAGGVTLHHRRRRHMSATPLPTQNKGGRAWIRQHQDNAVSACGFIHSFVVSRPKLMNSCATSPESDQYLDEGG